MRNAIAGTLIAFIASTSFGCQQFAPSQISSATPAHPAMGVDQLRADGLAKLERGQYEGALRAFVEALSRLPDDVGLNYLLAVTLSHADRKQDATLAFRWVVERGKPGSEEVEAARRWLAGVGIVVAARADERPVDEPEAISALEGRAEWAELDPEQGLPRIQLMLIGAGTSTQGRRYGIQSEINGPYRFPKVQPGEYRLRGQVGFTKLWDIPVTVGEPGDKTIVNLTQDNALSRDALKRKS